MSSVGRPGPRVLVDATAIPGDRTGVGRYVDELLAALDAAGEPVAIACQAADADRYRADLRLASVHPIKHIASRAARLVWEQTGLPRLAATTNVRIIHSPHYTVPIPTRLRRTVTFHDATFFSDPDVHTRAKRRFFPAWMRVSARLADGIVVPSAATATEVERYLGEVALGRMTVAHLGVDIARFHPPTPDERDDVGRRHDLGTRWIAYLGSVEPRKNVPALVDAYAEVAAAWADDPETLPALALAGGDGWDVDLAPHIAAVRSPGRVVRLGYLPLDDLHSFLGGAAAVVYPSLGEGFGLPLLEAMASGGPVLTTRRLSLPEVGGDAVHYVEPDRQSIADGIRTLLNNATLADQLRTAGRARASTFTWAACAQVHQRLWDGLLADQERRQ